MISTYSLGGGGDVHWTPVKADVNEVVLIYAYQDFIVSVTVFQKNNNGKSSKALAKELGKWDPEFDLISATKEERRKWRRTYTIKWLYDLVNLFSSLLVERNTPNGEKWDPSKVD